MITTFAMIGRRIALPSDYPPAAHKVGGVCFLAVFHERDGVIDLIAVRDLNNDADVTVDNMPAIERHAVEAHCRSYAREHGRAA